MVGPFFFLAVFFLYHKKFLHTFSISNVLFVVVVIVVVVVVVGLP